MSSDTTYRGYEIRVAGDAISPTSGVGGWRFIIRKGGEIVSEQVNMENAKALIDAYIEEEARRVLRERRG
jgi:hypothetical protein